MQQQPFAQDRAGKRTLVFDAFSQGRLSVYMSPGAATVVVNVVSGRNRVADTPVMLLDRNGEVVRQSNSNALGQVEFGNLPPGVYRAAAFTGHEVDAYYAAKYRDRWLGRCPSQRVGPAQRAAIMVAPFPRDIEILDNYPTPVLFDTRVRHDSR
jgi:hypothetical protein